jgi:hypothetical protein
LQVGFFKFPFSVYRFFACRFSVFGRKNTFSLAWPPVTGH